MTQTPPSKQHRRLKIALIATGALAAVLVAVLIVLFVLFVTVWNFPFGDDDAYQPDHMDAGRAAKAFASRDVTIPSEFEFVRATRLPVFTGKESYSGRYRITASLDRARALVTAANPSFPVFSELTCADENQKSLAALVPLPCPPGTPVLASVRHSLPQHVDPPPDSEVLILVVHGADVELVVEATGH
ncbi:MAG: hypothetical protein QM809_05900 [Gordonia sp. (in: high G+C Gram-positive bacteria)]|uniref:hypothetical protein n=1 Tax=Gordonia sp. (in: high G+C Gram-positive bacteria) TaxID=84139 RepID=UPI0039E25BB9